jgi:hypothetical protein
MIFSTKLYRRGYARSAVLDDSMSRDFLPDAVPQPYSIYSHPARAETLRAVGREILGAPPSYNGLYNDQP